MRLGVPSSVTPGSPFQGLQQLGFLERGLGELGHGGKVLLEVKNISSDCQVLIQQLGQVEKVARAWAGGSGRF